MQIFTTKTNMQQQLEQFVDGILEDFGIVDIILRNRKQFFAELRQSMDLPNKIIAMLISSIVFFVIYGAILGSTHSPLQAISSAIKLPIVFIGSSLICLPTLYVFSLLLGSNEKLGQTISLVFMGVTVTGVLLLSFAPITFLFMLTGSSYSFFKLLNVFFIMIAAYVGMSFLRQGRYSLEVTEPTVTAEEAASDFVEPMSKLSRFWQHTMFRGWLLLYFFVGTQLSWAMRPFIRHPNTPFRIFSETRGDFYSDIWGALGEVLGFWLIP